jgi:hypothetical protein
MAWEPSCWAYSWTPEKSRYAAKETSSPNGMATCADHGTSATRGSKTAKSQSIKRSQPTIILSQASGEKGLLEDVMKGILVEVRGVEPLTSAVRRQRSTTELHPRRISA